MALEKAVVSLLMGAKSMDAGRDPKLPGQGPLILENAQFDLDVIVGKRSGCVCHADTHVASTRLVPLHNQPAVFYGGYFGISDVVTNGVSQSRRDAFYYLDIARSADITAIAYTTKASATSYAVYIETYNNDSGGRIASYQADTGAAISFGRVLNVGSSMRYYVVTSSNTLVGGAIDPTTGAVSASSLYTTTTAPSATSLEWDCCAIEHGSGYVGLVYTSATAYRTCLLLLPGGDNAGVVTVNLDADNRGTVGFPSVWRQDADNVALAYVDNVVAGDHNLMAAIYKYDGSATRAATQIDTRTSAYTAKSTTGVAVSDTASTTYWTVSAVADSIPCVRYAGISTSGAGSAGWHLRRARLATKPARVPFDTYTNTHLMGVFFRSWGYSLGTQDTLYLISGGTPGTLAEVRGVALPGTARTGDGYGQLPRFEVSSGESKYFTACEWVTQVDNSADHKDLYQIGVVEFEHPISHPFRAWEAGAWRTLIPGSLPRDLTEFSPTYGDFFALYGAEHGFLAYPEPFTTAASATVGGMGAGTYKYKLVYERIDANGELHESAPTPEYSQIVLAASAVDVTCPTLHLAAWAGSLVVQIAVYRTKNNGTTYYRVGTVDNTTGANTVVFTDVQPDSFIGDMQTLYTDSGELPNMAARPHRVACVAGNRHLYADRNAESTDIYYSKRFGDREAVNHCAALKVLCDPAGGAITALHPFLDKVIVFKATRTYAMEGDGYDNAGGGTNYSQPWLINPSVGCGNQKCVAVTPMGLVFLGSDGHLWLIDHSLQCSIFSDPVHYFTDTVTPVALLTEPNRRLLHCMTGSWDLVYDWDKKLWSVWSGRECADAIEAGGTAWWFETAATRRVWHNDTTVWTDNGTRYALAADTGWISGGGLAAMQRMYWLFIIGQNIASHTLRVQIAYDMDPTWLDDATYDSSALLPYDVASQYTAGLAATYEGQAYVLRVMPTRPSCTSIRVRVSDSAGSGNTWSISAIALVIGQKRGAVRVDKARVL